jgi:hypothetical protein
MCWYRSPETLLAELGISEPSDILVEAIAEYCGATIVYASLEGCVARILGHGDRAIITVDGNPPRGRQRFSAGHELGHWMCDRGRIAFGCTEAVLTREWSDENPERRANRYAAELLLPEGMFGQHAKGREITLDTARMLAAVFQTSLTATAIRLVELGSFPAMLICSDGNRRRWFLRGPDVPEALWPYDQVRPRTVAYELLHGMGRAEGPVDVCADGWFGHRDAGRYAVREDSKLVSDEFVLTLLWWKDERQLLELDEDEED